MRYDLLKHWYIIPATILYSILIVCLLQSCARAEEIDLDKIAMIESSHNPKAYNKHSQAMGTYQITPICLADYNNYNAPRIDKNDLFSHEINEKVAVWYLTKRIPQMLKHYGFQDTVENRLISYNCGIGCVGKPLPTETKNYIEKYSRLSQW